MRLGKRNCSGFRNAAAMQAATASRVYRPLGLLLHDNRTGADSTPLDHIVDVEADQIAPA
jgi:hypothetical protein